jgi:hypothetical protein
MSISNSNLTSRHLTIVAASALLGLGAMTSSVHAAIGTVGLMQTDTAPIILAETQGMDRRQDRRDDRQDDRGDRRDTRQDCRDEEGVGKEKRDCKQDGRQESGKDDKG